MREPRSACVECGAFVPDVDWPPYTEHRDGCPHIARLREVMRRDRLSRLIPEMARAIRLVEESHGCDCDGCAAILTVQIKLEAIDA